MKKRKPSRVRRGPPRISPAGLAALAAANSPPPPAMPMPPPGMGGPPPGMGGPPPGMAKGGSVTRARASSGSSGTRTYSGGGGVRGGGCASKGIGKGRMV